MFFAGDHLSGEFRTNIRFWCHKGFLGQIETSESSFAVSLKPQNPLPFLFIGTHNASRQI
jgi:hypothetical protein